MTDAMFEAPGRFYRGNLHTHSTRSDGVLPAEEVCRLYRDEGYDFIAMTDHYLGMFDFPLTDTTGYRGDGFTTLLAAELHSGAMANGEIWHILAVGLPPGFTPPEALDFRPHDGQESGADLAARARDAGAYVVVPHPEWSGMTTEEAGLIEAAHAIEVYNHGCAVSCDRPHGFYTLDRLLERGHRLNICATDDAHFTDPDWFGGWTMVKAAENTPEALLAALKAGHSYASTGPEFHGIAWGDDGVEVSSSPVSAVIVQGPGIATVSAHGTELTRTTLPLARFGDAPWLRVTIVDAAGGRAWTNPVWREPA